MFCSNCGEKLADGSRFCPNCGKPVGMDTGNGSVPRTVKLRCKDCGGTLEIDSERKIFMCPFCGSKELLLDSDNVQIQKIQSGAYKDVEIYKTDAYRDVELRKLELEREIELSKLGITSHMSVKEIADKLQAIDSEKHGFFDKIISGGSDAIKEEKIARKTEIVKTCIVPTDIKSVGEFIHLAIANINVKLSKSGFGHNWAKGSVQSKSPEQGLSDAWVAKMMTVYQRASEHYGDNREFKSIARICEKTLKSLKIKL